MCPTHHDDGVRTAGQSNALIDHDADFSAMRTDWLIAERDRLESEPAKAVSFGDLQSIRNELRRREPLADSVTNVARDELHESWR